MVDSKVWNEVILVMLIHISLELLVSSSLCLEASGEIGTVAGRDRLFLSKLSSSLSEVVLGSDNIMVDSEVWNEVVLVVFIHISLELLVSSGLGLEASGEVSTVAGRD